MLEVLLIVVVLSMMQRDSKVNLALDLRHLHRLVAKGALLAVVEEARRRINRDIKSFAGDWKWEVPYGIPASDDLD